MFLYGLGLPTTTTNHLVSHTFSPVMCHLYLASSPVGPNSNYMGTLCISLNSSRGIVMASNELSCQSSVSSMLPIPFQVLQRGHWVNYQNDSMPANVMDMRDRWLSGGQDGAEARWQPHGRVMGSTLAVAVGLFYQIFCPPSSPPHWTSASTEQS